MCGGGGGGPINSSVSQIRVLLLGIWTAGGRMGARLLDGLPRAGWMDKWVRMDSRQ